MVGLLSFSVQLSDLSGRQAVRRESWRWEVLEETFTTAPDIEEPALKLSFGGPNILSAGFQTKKISNQCREERKRKKMEQP